METQGKNPFQLDSKEPNWTLFKDFLLGEVRYNALVKQFPEEAEQLFDAAEKNARWRYASYRRLADQTWQTMGGEVEQNVAENPASTQREI